jgi:ABC-type maltose transport system permease subunit
MQPVKKVEQGLHKLIIPVGGVETFVTFMLAYTLFRTAEQLVVAVFIAAFHASEAAAINAALAAAASTLPSFVN